ncbi:hypothetical protein TorRG33x02_100670 [Trema orientale]|uniref:Uncharacterized protein n=1 Tax=Trema orientale TaxID=63057 RepID=A0A2P5F8B5_TREOI|nr:hypothetical protein TorRG33x02_100670 [Trema orientale]
MFSPIISIFKTSIAPSTSAPSTFTFLTTTMTILTRSTLKPTQNRSIKSFTGHSARLKPKWFPGNLCGFLFH